MATLPTYATVEACARALDVHATADQGDTLARLTQTASRSIEEMLDREFYPTVATRTFRLESRARSLWLPGDLLSVTTLEVDDETVTGFALEPRFRTGPYRVIDLTDATLSAVGGGELISIAGVWGYTAATIPVGTLASAPDADDTAITVSDSTRIGVGSLLLCESERMVVTARALVSTTATLSGNPTASQADTVVGVSSGALVSAGETVTVDSERMLVRSVVGNNLLVRRAVDGSVLAAHSAAAVVYAPRALTVERAALGTTGASHSSSTALHLHTPPAPIVTLCVAEVLVLLGQEKAGWSMTVGEGDAQQEATGAQLGKLRQQARDGYRFRHYGTV